MAATIASVPPDQLPWPLFDLFLDVPHPAASASCPPPFIVPSPDSTEDLSQTIPQIARFAFPEYDGPVGQQQQQPPSSSSPAPLNRFDRYAMQAPGFQHFTFSLQLQSGTRLHGHVRRYLPPNPQAPARYDVGRRGERALVLLTRGAGADTMYAAILKSVEAISSQQAALPKDFHPRDEPQKWFLISLSRYQQHLASVYVTRPVAERGKPLIAALEGIELGINPKYKAVDVSRFIIPTSLLHRPTLLDPSATNSSSSILPLLRCVGVAHALRITAALLSERRVIMMSHSPTRLCNCSHAAIAILAQGMLHWQHLYIPVLPPHLWPYLAAPYPYLIGILASTAPKLDRTDGLGEVLIINLDVNTMETRGMDQATIAHRLPDLFQQAVQNVSTAASSAAAGSGVPAVQAAASPSEFLAQDLAEILRSDKRMLQGEANLANLGMETAAKATQAVKNTFFKLRDKGKQYLQNRSGSGGERDSLTPPPPGEESSFSETDVKALAADYVFTEGCRNEACEEDARVAFATFFLCMFGNMKWYLTPVGPGQVPQLDRNRFLQQKRAMGDGEGTPMWPLLQNFCQTQMLEEFVKARVEEIRLRQPVTPDAPLFVQCTNFHRQQNIDFGLLSVRQVCQQMAEANPSRVSQLQISARRNAMTLTSNKNFEGDYSKAVAALIEQCRESTAVLLDVMSVIWLRIRDAKGLQWKHAYQSLQLLRNLLLHGPIGAVAEATDGLDKIRALKYYENMRAQAAQQVRSAADFVYILLVDRAKLFSIRRFCAQRRREIRENKPEPSRDRRMQINAPFRNLHAFASPSSATGTVVRIPTDAARPGAMDRGAQQSQAEDLLGLSSPVAPSSAVQPVDPFSLAPTAQSAPARPPQSTPNDVLGLFDSLSVGDGNKTPQAASTYHDPFAVAPQPSPMPITAPLSVTPVSSTAPNGPALLGSPPAGQTTTTMPGQPGAPHGNAFPHPGAPPQPFLNPVGQHSQQRPIPSYGYTQQGVPQPPPVQRQQQAHGQAQLQQPPHPQALSGTPQALVTPTGAAVGQNQHPFASPPAQPSPYGMPVSQMPSAAQQQPPPTNRSQFDPFA